MPTPNLTSYKGSYTSLAVGDTASLTFTGEDIAIIFTTSATCTIKVKIDGLYQSQLKWYTGDIDAVSDVFDVGYTADHSYYDGVDQSTSKNPSILRLATVLTYGVHTIEIEVITGDLKLEAFFVYKESVWNSVYATDSTFALENLSTEIDIEDLRTDIVVTGAGQGVFQNGSEVMNPNNPLTLRTFSRAVDIGIMYKADHDDYIGRRIPFEIFNERIFSQRRADHISLSALEKYRTPASSISTSFPGDPRYEPLDAITFREKKLNLMGTGKTLWIDNISEKHTIGGSTIRLSTIPRPPISSFMEKESPDLQWFNGEPLINLELKSQGKRVAGNGATESSGVITIANDPGYTPGMWVGYYLYDDSGHEFPITANTSDTITVQLYDQSYADGNWSISFDPFDTNLKGAPLEIHYDQVVNGLVQIWVKDSNGDVLSKVNADTFNEVQEWGTGKVVYWSGMVEFNVKEGKSGCYVSPFSANYDLPLSLKIVFTPEDANVNPIIIKSNTGGSGLHDGNIYVNTVQSAQSSLGAIRIYPKLLNHLPLINIQAGEGQQYAKDVIESGRVFSWTDASGTRTLDIDPLLVSGTNDLVDYLIFFPRIRYSAIIIANTTTGGSLDTIEISDNDGNPPLNDMLLNEYFMVMGQDNIGVENLAYDHFKSSDYMGQGLRLTAECDTQVYDERIAYLANGPFTTEYTSYFDEIAYQSEHYSAFEEYLDFAQSFPWHHFRLRSLLWYEAISGGSILHREIYPYENILSEFRIVCNLTVYKIVPGPTLSIVNESPIEIVNTDSFISLDDWSMFFSPNTLAVDDSNAPLNIGDAGTWFFVFEFSFMDRAGRFVLNRWEEGSREEIYGNERPFYYVAGWKPDDLTKTALTQGLYGLQGAQSELVFLQHIILPSARTWWS